MHEYIIHLPIADNDGNDIALHINDCITHLITEFGGATISDAQGMWMHEGKLYNEPVKRVVLAGPDCAEHINYLKYRAQVFAIQAKQLSMYIVTPQGVEIMDTSKQAAFMAA